MTKDEALTLEALKYAASKGYGRIVREMKIAPFTIKGGEALAQPAQEPESLSRWKYKGHDSHNNEEVYECAVCGTTDWIASYGTESQLRCKCRDSAKAQPAPPPPECKTEAEQTAYAFGWWKALESVRTEPDWKDLFEKQKRRAEMWIAKYEKDIGPLEKAVPVAQEPRNFCSRCGKRTADLTVIHTCTPPEGGRQ